MHKSVCKNTKYSKNKTIVKICHLAKNDSPSKGSLQNGQHGSKIKNAKNMQKNILQ